MRLNEDNFLKQAVTDFNRNKLGSRFGKNRDAIRVDEVRNFCVQHSFNLDVFSLLNIGPRQQHIGY